MMQSPTVAVLNCRQHMKPLQNTCPNEDKRIQASCLTSSDSESLAASSHGYGRITNTNNNLVRWGISNPPTVICSEGALYSLDVNSKIIAACLSTRLGREGGGFIDSWLSGHNGHVNSFSRRWCKAQQLLSWIVDSTWNHCKTRARMRINASKRRVWHRRTLSRLQPHPTDMEELQIRTTTLFAGVSPIPQLSFVVKGALYSLDVNSKIIAAVSVYQTRQERVEALLIRDSLVTMAMWTRSREDDAKPNSCCLELSTAHETIANHCARMRINASKRRVWHRRTLSRLQPHPTDMEELQIRTTTLVRWGISNPPTCHL